MQERGYRELGMDEAVRNDAGSYTTELEVLKLWRDRLSSFRNAQYDWDRWR